MSNYIFQKTKISTFAILAFSITVVVAIASFLVLVSSGNGSRLHRHISGHTPEIVLTAINEHIDQQEEQLSQHVQQSEILLDQNIQKAELSWDETLEKPNQMLDDLNSTK